MIVLDTDHLTLLFSSSGQATRKILQGLERVESNEIVTTIVSFEEQARGRLAIVAQARTSQDLVESYRRLAGFLKDYQRIPVIGFDESAAAVFFDLKRWKIRVPTMDLRIAAIVLSRDGLLLSRNLADFRKIPGLRVEDGSV